MKRLLLYVTALLSATLCLDAATNKADEMLSRASARLRSGGSIEAKYMLTADGGSAAGAITLQGDKFHIYTPSMTVWFDGKTQWTYDPSMAEVSVCEPTSEELQQINPFAVIEAFRTAYTATVMESASDTERILLKAKSKNADITTATLTLDPATAYPRSLQMTLADGTQINIAVSSIKKGPVLPESRFRFDSKKYPGVEIIDLR